MKLASPTHAAAPRARRDRTGAGFTIVEVVLAMAILLVGMSVILGLLAFGAALSRTAALRTSASAAVQAVVADLEAGLFPMLENGSAGEPRPIERREVPGHPGILYSASATPHPEQIEMGGVAVEYRVDIEISWNTAGSTRSKRFTTLLTREIPFGERMRLQFVKGQPGPELPRTNAPRGPADEAREEP